MCKAVQSLNALYKETSIFFLSRYTFFRWLLKIVFSEVVFLSTPT